jgi:hypothetical protein
VVGKRVFDRLRYASQRRLVQDVARGAACLAAIARRADVALDEAQVAPLRPADGLFDLGEVLPFAGGEVVQPDDPLVELEQALEQVRARCSAAP